MRSDVEAEATGRNDGLEGNTGKKGGVRRESARGAAQIQHVPGDGVLALCRDPCRGQHKNQDDEAAHYLAPLAFRRSAQYLRIL